MPLRFAVGPSGGLAYHLKALRRADHAWQPFRARVRHFLAESWAPPEKEIIVFGPSAGWTLPFDWLAHFERVLFIEPDPLARFLLKRKFPRASFDSSSDYLPWLAKPDARGARLRELLARHPNAALLFANVLGQLKLLMPKKERADAALEEECRRLFLDGLRGRTWASYHDVLSSKSPFTIPFPSAPPLQRDLESIARHYFSQKGGVVAIVDHDTIWLEGHSERGERPSEFAAWTLDAASNHLIGFVAGPGSGPSSPKKP